MDQKGITGAIAAGEEVLKAEREQEGVVLANLGQVLYEAGRGSEASAELLGTVEESVGKLHELEDSLRETLALDNRRKELNEESRTLKVELRNFNNRKENALEDLGRAAWEGWKNNSGGNAPMEAALADLIQADEKIHDVEVAAFRNESIASEGKKNLLARGRSLFLAGRKRNASASMEKLWGKAGRLVYETIDVSELEGMNTSASLAVLRDIDGRLEEIRVRREEIDTETGEADRELEDLPGKGGIRKRLSWMEKAIETGRTVLDDAYLALGRGWMDSGNEAGDNSRIDSLSREAAAACEAITHREEDLKAFRVHLKFMAAESEKGKKAAKVHRLEVELKERQAHLKAEKKELAAMAKELEAMAAELPVLPGGES